MVYVYTVVEPSSITTSFVLPSLAKCRAARFCILRVAILQNSVLSVLCRGEQRAWCVAGDCVTKQTMSGIEQGTGGPNDHDHDNNNNTNSAWNQAMAASTQLASQAVLEDLEQQYVALKEERDAMAQQLEHVQAELQAAKTAVVSNQNQQAQAADLQHKLSVAQQQVKAREEEKTAVDERVERLQAESDRLREEIRYDN